MATLALSLAGQVVGGAVGGLIGATIGRALGALAGSAVDSALFGERVQQSRGDIRLTGSSEGGAVPRLYGWGRLAGNIIWASELEEIAEESRGAKGTSDEDGGTVVASFAVALCEGEVQRLGRIWADGQVLDTADINVRFYSGSDAQAADSLIEAVQGEGAAPAYRGLCYLVFERLPLAPFGNRIPSISVELCRVVGELEPMIRSVTVIPGATEFGYDPEPRVRVVRKGVTVTENMHLSPSTSDWTMSIDELCDLCPNLEHVSLVVAWFGDDLRAGHCTVAPRVEAVARTIKGTSWNVAGLGRGAARVVSSHAGGPAYGGTPSDAAVRAAIADLTARGLAVTVYPMLLMDIPAGNVLGQPAYPWRGRIAAENGAGAVAAVAAFMGSTGGWGYRRFIRHYAALAAEAGAEALVIGSEMVGLARVEDAAGGFPFVDALVALAAEARAVAGPDLKLTYAADWSDYSGYQPGDRPGDKLFPLDALWASPDIAAVGIDNYLPLADWREGETHADALAGYGRYDLAYLDANIEGGEGFDWYYQSDADRLAGTRTPIFDGAHGEHWIWRFKDIAGWWGHAHHERRDGVRSTTPTAWVPGMKPVWFTELGCAAVDKGANAPNRFADPKSAEDGRPPFSSGAPDALMQRQALRAQLRHWNGPANPVSPVYGGPMVNLARVSLWTWDARPFPAFPAEADIWADAANHATGHWLTGRLGGLAADELARAVAADHGVELGRADVGGPLVLGLCSDRLGSVRERLEPVLALTGLAVRAGAEDVEIVRSARVAAQTVDDPVVLDGPIRTRRRPDAGEAVAALTLGYLDRQADYLQASARASLGEAGAMLVEDSALVLDGAAADQAAEARLAARAQRGESLDIALPPSLLALEPGDVLALAGEGGGPFEVVEFRDGLARRATLRPLPPVVQATRASVRRGRAAATPSPAGEVDVVLAHLPPLPGEPGRARLVAGAFASPWPGAVDVLLAGTRLMRLTRPAALGEVVVALEPGRPELWQDSAFEVDFNGGHVATGTEEAVLGGSNRIAVETDGGEWEVLGFAQAELLAPRRYRLGHLLRGLEGSNVAAGPIPAGRRVLLIDDRVATVAVADDWPGASLTFSIRTPRSIADEALALDFGLAPILPLAPAHLRSRRLGTGDVVVTWVRRSRADGGNWAAVEVPLELMPERYRITIADDGEVRRVIETELSGWTYDAAAQVADFGSLPASFEITLCQLSPTLGAGHAAGIVHGA